MLSNLARVCRNQTVGCIRGQRRARCPTTGRRPISRGVLRRHLKNTLQGKTSGVRPIVRQ